MVYGYATQLAIDSAWPVQRGYEFAALDFGARCALIDGVGMRSDAAPLEILARPDVTPIEGTIDLIPGVDDFRELLPWIVGPESEGVYRGGEQLSARTIAVDNVGEVLEYSSCYVRRAVFETSIGKPVSLRLQLVGRTEIRHEPGALPALTYSQSQPFRIADSQLTVADKLRSAAWWRLSIENQLQCRYNQSQQVSQVVLQGRSVLFEMQTPWTDDTFDLRANPIEGAATLRLAGAGRIVTFQLGDWQALPVAPAVTARNELTLALAGRSRRWGSSSELSATLS